MKKQQLATFSTFFLLILMFFKVGSFHVYTHDNDSHEIEECKICDSAIENQEAEFAITPQITIASFNNLIRTDKNIFNLPVLKITSTLYYTLFGRPPPFSI